MPDEAISVFSAINNVFSADMSILYRRYQNLGNGYAGDSTLIAVGHPQALKLLLQSPGIVTSARLVGGVIFGR